MLSNRLCARTPFCAFSSFILGSVTLIGFFSASVSYAQSNPQPVIIPDIVVTPTRTPQAISKAGSSITVLDEEDIAKASPGTITDLFRQVPGVSVTQSGGAGSTQTVRLRGMDARHTLVLIDGIRVNDPSSPTGEFDFSNLILTDIERIEVLRGPQSALYGSDAMGGVIHIITRKGKGAPQFKIQAEGGSYGTKSLSGSVSGGNDTISYAFGASTYHTAGFSSWGYRIGRLKPVVPWGLEPDGAIRQALTGKVSVKLSNTWQVELGGYAAFNKSQYDAAFGAFPDTPSVAKAALINGHARLTGDSFDGFWKHTLTVYGNETNRDSRSISYFGFGGFPPLAFGTDYGYRGTREGVEYQGDLKFGAFGTLSFGAKSEREGFRSDSQNIIPTVGFKTIDDKAHQVTNAAFIQHQITVFERLHLSLGGRIDDVRDVATFPTWRATAAYEISETETKLRASAGTGAKAPSLFQLYSRLYGTPTLEPETSFGVDAGVDQMLFDGRVKLSGSVFLNRYRNYIDFSSSPKCAAIQFFGCYQNVARAETSGFEGQVQAILIKEFLDVRLTYTHLHAVDLVTNKLLARRPENEGRVTFIITPMKNLTIEPSLILVGDRYSSPNERLRLQPYARLDTRVDYKVNDNLSVYVRGENLTNAKYEEIRDYGTTGRAVYGGVKATW
jgi:vitamin B12 transporter